MLYLVDEYSKQHPHRRLCEIQRFESTDKFLHEMTIDEVNSECKNWESVSTETAANTKRKIAQYLKWLVEEQGCSVNFNAAEINLPIKEDIVPQIYSTNDIHKYYKELENALERTAIKNGSNPSMFFLNMTHAAGILSFYGLSDSEILDLDLSDVQSDGVVGYDLPLTKEDIDVLLSYKYQTRCDNKLLLQGTKYIRSASHKAEVQASFLNRPLILSDIEKDCQYLKTILKTSYLSLCGKFNRAYHMEKTTKDYIVNNKVPPQWFINIFQVGTNMIIRRKKEYIAYRDQRDFLNPESANEIIAKPVLPKEIISDRLDFIQKHIEELNKEAEELKKQLQESN